MEYQVIVGIRIDGKEMDYCREQVDATDIESARSKAENMIRNAPKPSRGELFLRRVEDWN